MRRAALVIAVLCAIAAFFGWKAQEAWFAPLPPVGAAGAPAATLAAGGAADPAPQPELAGAVAAIAARPLFRPDRLSFRDGAGEGRDGNADLSRFSLIGVLTLGQGLKGIVVSKDGSGPGRWELKAGDSLPGFKVKEVRLDGLVLDAEGRKVLLPLYAGPPPADASPRTDPARNAPLKAPATAPKSAVTVVQPPRDAAKAVEIRQPQAAPVHPNDGLPPGAFGKGLSATRVRTIHEGFDEGENQ